jgi:hypothetical protein
MLGKVKGKKVKGKRAGAVMIVFAFCLWSFAFAE